MFGCFLFLSACFTTQKRKPLMPPPAYPKSNHKPLIAGNKAVNRDGSLFSEDGDIYTDTSAHKKGDILTVIIQELSNIKQDDKVELKKKSSTSTSAEPKNFITKYIPVLGPNQFSALKGERDSNHNGEVKYYKKSRVTDRMAVVITEVRPDGLLTLWGKRQMVLDGETKTVTLTGLVNTNDIRPDNTVFSDRIALSSINFEGHGTLTSTTEPGLGAKTFRWVLDLLWPF